MLEGKLFRLRKRKRRF